ncbi:MAG: hypothetical protein VX498_01785 [Myxococcota bacterium]|nr:hypothetical protein [Myxococcota bacterium]
MSEARPGFLKRLVSSPWPVTVGLLGPLVLWYGAVQWKGFHLGALSHSMNEQGEGGGLMELWVHGEQPWFSWVPFIHPPGYSIFMNLTAFTSDRLGIEPSEQILLQGTATKVLVVLLLAWAVSRWAGALWGMFSAALFTVSPNAIRPFEHYPVATLLSTLAIIAVVDWSLRGDRRARAGAIAAVFVAVGLHLSIWFVVGGTIATLFILLQDRRREILRASCWMIGLFLLTCWGLPDVLVSGPGHGPEKTPGVVTIEWTNPVLLGACLLAFLPWAFRGRTAPALAGGVLFFTAVTCALQKLQVADGNPYPASLHYFELIEPVLVIVPALSLAAWWKVGGRWARSIVILVMVALMVTQCWLFLQGQSHPFEDRVFHPHWFWMLVWPGGAGGT